MTIHDAIIPVPGGSAPTAAAPPRRRKPGRPARISRAIILRTSLQILDQTTVDDFMVKSVAELLGTSSMAIYRYFPSRDALLGAVADELCRTFHAPRAAATWQDTVTRWLWALERHADRHPAMLYVLSLNGRVSREWVRLTIPITNLMVERAGLRDKQLTIAMYLFGVTAFSILRAIADIRATHAGHLLPRIADVTTDDREVQVLRQTRLRALGKREAIEALIEQYVAGVELLRRRAEGRTRRCAAPARHARRA
ncbi:MAG: TetR family transcriptional regulator [Proteobacteria bacterium]|nr:TetR family transcriptional regulator [Pseudomonadota bacterium]